jgi:DNA-binding response OmpR family regulator
LEKAVAMRIDDPMRVLIVDGSDAALAETRNALGSRSLEIVEAKSATQARDMIERQRPHLMIAEVRLPDASGFALCRSVREEGPQQNLPVILISEWTTEIDRVLALECGADDFLGRPFFGRELNSRVSAVLRRRPDLDRVPDPQQPRISSFAGQTQAGMREVRLAGKRLELTPKENAILVHLAACQGGVRSRQQLIATIWGDRQPPSDRCIDSHIKSLRRKLGQAGDAVETVRGVGYRFSPHQDLVLR